MSRAEAIDLGPVALQSTLSAALSELGANERQITVSLSNELVHLLSEQMYRSPIKAIEELVVNAYDADATHCRLTVPLPPSDVDFLAIYDDGVGMDVDGLQDLWHIGRSNKRDEEVQKRLKRRQIGKFGIGKLATYAIANLVTYVSKSSAGINGVTMDFRRFAEDPTGGHPIGLDITSLDVEAVTSSQEFTTVFERLDLDVNDLRDLDSWTLVVVEDLKPRIARIRRRDLNWVLSTAMPLRDDFELTLNGTQVVSRKAEFTVEVSFSVSDLPQARIEALEAKSADGWRLESGTLLSNTFVQGIRGDIVVTKQSLYGGKSSDLARSHGFFVKVRGRLVEESDPLFGIEPLSYEVFNRFRADLEADDLDEVVTAPREGFEASDMIDDFESVLQTLFYEARGRYEALQRDREEKEGRLKEDERNFVNPSLVERPIADALTMSADDEGAGSDADETWFYLRLGDLTTAEVIERLYDSERERYGYEEIESGRSGRLAVFDPGSATFYINVDHPLVQAHSDPKSRYLLEDVVTAEVLLEVYLREQGMRPPQVGEVLERRDQLLRSLAADHIFSLDAIAAQLRNSVDDEHDLEVNLVIAARALGFVAKHLAGSGRADGVARFSEYPGGERKIALEAKSSEEVPSLDAIDFAGLAQHARDEGAEGCLLIAPAYPGSRRGDDAQAAKRARSERVSCWTVEQLASVVAAAEKRHISAADVLAIVLSIYAPDDVAASIETLLADPSWVPQELMGAVVDALRSLEGRLADSPRTVDKVASEITHNPTFASVPQSQIRTAVQAVVGASQGLLQLIGGDKIVIRGTYDELERRVGQLIGRAGETRRLSTFKEE